MSQENIPLPKGQLNGGSLLERVWLRNSRKNNSLISYKTGNTSCIYIVFFILILMDVNKTISTTLSIISVLRSHFTLWAVINSLFKKYTKFKIKNYSIINNSNFAVSLLSYRFGHAIKNLPQIILKSSNTYFLNSLQKYRFRN